MRWLGTTSYKKLGAMKSAAQLQPRGVQSPASS